jgi:hypothetical protein
MNSGFSKPKMVTSMVERGAFYDHVVKDAADIVLRPNPHILLSPHREHTHKILYPSYQPFLDFTNGALTYLRICIIVVPIVQICHPATLLLPAFDNSEGTFHEPLVEWLDYIAKISRQGEQSYS